MKKRLLALALSTAMLLLLVSACGGGAATPPPSTGTTAPAASGGDTSTPSDDTVYTLTMNSTFSNMENDLKTHWYTERWFFDEVAARSNGRLKIVEYYNGELYATADLLDALSNGAVDMGFAAGHSWGQVIPEAFMSNIPLWADSAEHARQTIRDGGLGELYDAAFLEMGVRPLEHWIGAPYSFMTNFPVENFSDLNGKLFRASGGLFKIWYDNMGIQSVDIPAAEAYDALSRGIIDGDSQGWSAIKALKLGEVTSYISTPSWQNAIMVTMYINEDKFQSLPEDLQQILVETALEAEKLAATEGDAEDYAGFAADIETYNLTVTEMSEAEFEKLRASTAPMYDAWRAMGDRCGQMLDIMTSYEMK